MQNENTYIPVKNEYQILSISEPRQAYSSSDGKIVDVHFASGQASVKVPVELLDNGTINYDAFASELTAKIGGEWEAE